VSNFELSNSDLKVRFVTPFRLRSESFAIDFSASEIRNTSEVIEFLYQAKISEEELYIYSQDGEVFLSCDEENDGPEQVQIYSMTTSYEKTDLVAVEHRAELARLQAMYDRNRQITLELKDKLQNVQELATDRLAWLTTSHSNCEVGSELEQAYAKAIRFFHDIKKETLV
jgi:hypothetical protein